MSRFQFLISVLYFYVGEKKIMAGSQTYSKKLPDITDLDNDSGEKPGYKVFVLERDGGVSIQMQDVDDKSDSDTLRAFFMNVDEAKELVVGLNDAINRASYKNANHKSRAKNI